VWNPRVNFGNGAVTSTSAARLSTESEQTKHFECRVKDRAASCFCDIAGRNKPHSRSPDGADDLRGLGTGSRTVVLAGG
jgi:hypothetical protein